MTSRERNALTRALLEHARNARTLEHMHAQLKTMGSTVVVATLHVRLEAERQAKLAEECKRKLGLWRASLGEVVEVARRVVSRLEG